MHVTEAIRVDTWLGGGELPTQHLQEALCGDPCRRSNPPHWYDGALTAVYYTHFIAAPLVALMLYLRNRAVWLSFMRRYVTLYMAGLLVYITYPMAPPWMASRDGYVDGPTVVRITGRGWDELNIEHFHQWLSRMGNQVAAMPSLHAGTAALIAFYGIARLRSRWRACCCSTRSRCPSCSCTTASTTSSTSSPGGRSRWSCWWRAPTGSAGV